MKKLALCAALVILACCSLSTAARAMVQEQRAAGSTEDAKATGEAARKQERKQGKRAEGKINLDEARRRWERLTPEEQKRLRGRYDKLRRMGEGERRELERHRSHLRKVHTRLVGSLNEHDRGRLAALSPEERERILREMVEDELREDARRLEAKLPDRWRERLRDASPEDRRRFFKDFKRQARREWSPRALERLGRELDIAPEQIEAWKKLPPEQQKQKLLELGKRERRRVVERDGLPAGVDEEQWKRLKELPPEGFFEEAMRMRDARGWEPGRPFFGGPPEDVDDAWRAGARSIRRAARPRPEDRLEFSHLPPEERRQKVEGHRRERLLGALASSGLVAPAEIEQMRALPSDEFWTRARHWNKELGLGLGHGRRRPGGPPEHSGERERRGPHDRPDRRGEPGRRTEPESGKREGKRERRHPPQHEPPPPHDGERPQRSRHQRSRTE